MEQVGEPEKAIRIVALVGIPEFIGNLDRLEGGLLHVASSGAFSVAREERDEHGEPGHEADLLPLPGLTRHGEGTLGERSRLSDPAEQGRRLGLEVEPVQKNAVADHTHAQVRVASAKLALLARAQEDLFEPAARRENVGQRGLDGRLDFPVAAANGQHPRTPRNLDRFLRAP